MALRGGLVAIAGSLAALAALSLVACGGGGGGAAAGGAMSAAPSNVIASRSAVVSADLDGDGLQDLAAIARDVSAAAGPALCWRNVGGGEFAPAPPAWTAGSALPAIAADGDTCDDSQLTDGFGVRGAHRPGRASLPYAVLHLGDGTDATPVVASAPPTIDEIEPASGPTHALVAIEGSALAARGVVTGVTFGTVSATVLFAFPDYVLAVVPDGLAEGATEVRVTRGDLTSAPMTFTVVTREVPVVTAIIPSTVVVGTVAMLRGEHLGTPLDHVDVQFFGVPSTTRAIGLVRAAAVVVPSGAQSGPATITVNGVVSAPFDVTVGSLPAPVVTSLSPASASVGSVVRVAGTDLFAVGEPPSVTFSGTPAAILGLNEGSLLAIVPPGAADGDVVVTVGGRSSTGIPFDVVARGLPTITTIEPVSGVVGDLIDVKGTDLVDLSAWRPGRPPPFPLLGDLRVVVGGRTAWFVIPSSEGLRVIVPPGAVTGDVIVAVNGVQSNPFPFTVN